MHAFCLALYGLRRRGSIVPNFVQSLYVLTLKSVPSFRFVSTFAVCCGLSGRALASHMSVGSNLSAAIDCLPYPADNSN